MPSNQNNQPPFTIYPFDPKIHGRKTFSCGVAKIDNYLKRTAKKHSKTDVVRIRVIMDTDNDIVGFYGINTHSIAVKDLPEFYQKKAGNRSCLPAVFIAMIGVDQTQQNNGIGKALIADALYRIAKISDEIGITVIVLDVSEDGDPDAVVRRKTYYENFGFLPLPDQPLRLFMPIQTARQLAN